MGLSRKVAILLGVSALALGGCGDALWPTTDAPDPQGGSGPSAQAEQSTQETASGGTTETTIQSRGTTAEQQAGRRAQETRTAQAPQAQAAPPAVSATTPAAGTPPAASNGTFVGKKVTEMQGDLAKLQSGVQSLQARINQLAQRASADTQRYHNLVASVASRLQQGSTPGNPILTAQWNEAQVVLEQVAGTLPAMTKISNDAADQAAFGQFLLNSVQATFGLSGAVEEDHRRLQILEDQVYQNIVQIDRLMNDLAQDINRQTSYVNNERQNLTTLSLAIKNGELYGTSLATRAFTQSNVIARAEAEAQGPGPGERPLVIIRFDRPNVEYQQALYNAVSQALARKPDAVFNLVAINPAKGTPSQIALNSSQARRNAEQVLRTLAAMGVPSSRVSLLSSASQDAVSNEVHLYVR